MALKLLAQGAESKLFVKGNELIKQRISKSYRIKQLDDKLRRQRTKSEARIMKKAQTIINIPKILSVNDYEIVMEYLDSPVIRDVMNLVGNEKLKEIGKMIAKLHNNSIIHGDLTTSNMIMHDNKIFLIDFGLSSISSSIEDMAVDLHVLKQALTSRHYIESSKAWNTISKSYIKHCSKGKEVLERLKIVESRGRKSSKV